MHGQALPHLASLLHVIAHAVQGMWSRNLLARTIRSLAPYARHSSSSPNASYVGISLKEITETLSAILRIGSAAYVFQTYCLNSSLIVGPSMLPTLNSSGDVLLTEHVSPRFSRLKSGDVVMAVKPNDGKVTVVKRIRGMPGERILVHRRGVSHLQDIIVPDGHVWLEGDNPESSTDSRDYGPVPLALVRGRIIARFWPPSKMCLIESRIIHHLSEAEECNVYRDMASVSLYEKQNEEDCLPTTKSPSSA